LKKFSWRASFPLQYTKKSDLAAKKEALFKMPGEAPFQVHHKSMTNNDEIPKEDELNGQARMARPASPRLVTEAGGGSGKGSGRSVSDG
jgi:hypothetical protein